MEKTFQNGKRQPPRPWWAADRNMLSIGQWWCLPNPEKGSAKFLSPLIIVVLTFHKAGQPVPYTFWWSLQLSNHKIFENYFKYHMHSI